MKSHLLIATLSAFVLAACSSGKEVNYPTSSEHTSDLEVYHLISRKDRITFEVTAYGKPGSSMIIQSSGKLKGCQTGTTYELLEARECKLDTAIIYPESGTFNFELDFQPVMTEDEEVHWVQNKGDTLFNHLQIKPKRRQEGEFACHIRGKVHSNKPCRRILLIPSFGEYPLNRMISVPVHNNRFDYTLYADTPSFIEIARWEELLELGFFRTNPIFIEKGTVSVELNMGDTPALIKKAGPLNMKYQACLKEIDGLEASRRKDVASKRMNGMTYAEKFTPEGAVLQQRQDSLMALYRENGQLTPEQGQMFNVGYLEQMKLMESGKYFSNTRDSLSKVLNDAWLDIFEHKEKYVQENDDFIGLVWLKELTGRHLQTKDYKALQKDYSVYIERYKDRWQKNPMAEFLSNQLKISFNMHPGTIYKDYPVTDYSGNLHSVMDYIGGKWAVVDLWASWCKGCRINSQLLIPLYEKYKDKNLTVIGIALEKDPEQGLQAIKEDQYPWNQFVEDYSSTQLWARHGMNEVGGRFLVSPEGKLIAVNPTIEEIESYINQK